MSAIPGASFGRGSIAIVIAGVAGLVLNYSPRCLAQTPGLVAAYNFSEGNGTTVTDLSGNNLTGTVVGATWTSAGKYGKALSFDGASSYVDLGNPAALQLTGSMTLEAWVNAAANPSDDGQIIAKSNGPGWQLKTTPDTGPHTFGVKAYGSTSAQRASAAARALNTWYHVAGVYNASAGTLDIYVNGVLNDGVLAGTIPASQLNQAVNVNIGRRSGGYYFNGIIDEVRIYNRALSQTEIQTDMNTPVGGTPPPPDPIPPTVAMSAPANGATVAGTVSVSASASDNVGVAGVQFLLDGVNLGSEVATAPFTFQWNTATATIGAHTLSAIARDFSNNTTVSSSIAVTVTNPSASQIGQWTPIMNWPIVAVHAILMPTGNVLAWTDYTINEGAQVWRPSTNTFIVKPENVVSLFCAGHVFLADGKVFVVGGITGLQDDLGPRNTTIFDPVTESWSQAGLMVTGRYYPTATILGDGRILVMGGTTTCASCIADTPEIYNPLTDTWTEMASSARMSFKYYPHSYVLPDGRVLVTSQDDSAISSRVLNLTTQTWVTVDSRVFDGHSSVMYLPGKFMKAGTATADNQGQPSFATTYVLDMTQSSPAWQQTASMANPRSYLNLTILPDGQVLATGGSTNTDKANVAAAVYAAEMWSPTTKTWTTMSSEQRPREYHSTALLLPDARVLVAGGGRQNGRSQPDPKDQANAEIFSPPYLFKGARPVISAAPSLIQYGASFQVTTPDAARIGSISLIALSAVTHAFNESQRLVPLTFQAAGSSLSVNAPVDGNLAPPGPYMLFLVDNTGVPSVAAMVRLPAPSEDTQAPTAPSGLNAVSTTSSVSLTWSASTDNVGVTGYSVYRSTTSGFAPTPANKIAQTSTTAYTDSSFPAAGTYYYVVTAQDARGNISAASNEAFGVITPDTTPPTVSISAPSSGATVAGVITVTASATDNINVAGVQFLLDGSNLGAEVTGNGPTYSLSWSTAASLNGSHTLSARARDGAGNTALATNVNVTIANVVSSGLAAGYTFGEGSGTTTVDSSSNGLNGTISGASWTTAGKYGNALSFNGTSSYVDLGNSATFQNTGSMTVSAWVKATAAVPDDGQIVAKSGDGGGWQLKTTPDTGPNTFAIKVTGSAGPAYRHSNTVRVLNTWYHLAGVYNATTQGLDIYVNGVLDNGALRGAVPTAQILQNVNVNVGRRTGGYYFNGVVDEVRIYSRALSQSEIQADMNAAVGSGAPSDTIPPSVALTAPTNGANLNGTFSVTASATDNTAMAGVQFLLDGGNLGSEVAGAGPTYTFNWITTTATNGPHILSARARDVANNTATATNVNVTVSNGDVTPPTVSVTSPSAGSSVGGTVVVTASATDNIAMAGVQLLVDGANVGAEVTGTGPTYTFNWNTTGIANGAHILSARARDASNNTALAVNVSVIVANAAPTGLLAAYSLNQGSGTTAVDGSGNGITGTLAGATWTTAGKYANSLSFNGTSGYVDLGNPTLLQSTGSMTWVAWVKATANPADDGQIIAKSTDGGGWQLKTSPDTGSQTFAVKVTGSTGQAYRYSRTVRALNTWYHVAGVYNATTQTLDIYVNGVLDNGTLRGTVPTAQVLQGVNVNMGQRTGGYYFNGVIDEVQIYNRALSAAEIQTLMNAPLP